MLMWNPLGVMQMLWVAGSGV